MDHKATEMCKSDFSRLQRMVAREHLKYFPVFSRHRNLICRNQWFRARKIELAPISRNTIGVAFCSETDCTQVAVWKSVSPCHVIQTGLCLFILVPYHSMVHTCTYILIWTWYILLVWIPDEYSHLESWPHGNNWIKQYISLWTRYRHVYSIYMFAIYKHVCTCYVHVHNLYMVCNMYIHVHAFLYLYVHCTNICMDVNACLDIVQTS